MEVKARLSTVRIAPRKLGLLADSVRGKGINQAVNTLKYSPRKRTAGVLLTLIKSAVANATQKGTMDVDNLVVSRIFVGQGPTHKRFRPRAKGSAFRINKKTSHVTVFLGEKK